MNTQNYVNELVSDIIVRDLAIAILLKKLMDNGLMARQKIPPLVPSIIAHAQEHWKNTSEEECALLVAEHIKMLKQEGITLDFPIR